MLKQGLLQEQRVFPKTEPSLPLNSTFFFFKVSESSKKGRETISVMDTGQLRFYPSSFITDRSLSSLF